MAELCRIDFLATDEACELLSALLTLRVSHGWEEEQLASGKTRFRVHSPIPEFCSELVAEIKAALPGIELEEETIEELDWVSSWKEFFTPVEAGKRFLVLAPWMQKEKALTDRQPVIIEPKTAFGTGHHATTALCLQAISELLDSGAIKAGDSFFDLGTGSGILGIALALSGLSGLGVDPDLLAVENANDNRALNQISPEDFKVCRGSLEVAGGHYRIVVANILAEPLINMASGLVALLEPGGVLVLSGILATQAENVESAYRVAGLGPARVTVQGEWVSLVWVLA